MSVSAKVKNIPLGLPATVLLFILPVLAQAQNVAVTPPNTGSGIEWTNPKPPFPALFFTDYYNSYKAQESARPYWVTTEEEANAQAKYLKDNISMLLNNDILAFYGHPNSLNMGILGRFSKEELDARLTYLARQYQDISGGRRILRAFYIIYGTVWPEGDIGIIKESLLLEYIQYALEHDILVFIDHQIGRYDPVESLKKMFPYLRYPNVHLALDPEWRTTKPMQEIGAISADEVNRAQKVLEEYMLAEGINGERMLVIHQFNWRMIGNRAQVKTGSDKVRLIHCADGFGAPSVKRQSYAYNAQAKNMPLKGFKLFYNFGIPGAGYDNPLLLPEEVYALDPRPYLLMYQ
ncbi:MAG: hypothetical protein LBG22_10010 [Treponema sp.]|jgi:hypothetical protein|nr:hypothetical protein [Treponema sp.]